MGKQHHISEWEHGSVVFKDIQFSEIGAYFQFGNHWARSDIVRHI